MWASGAYGYLADYILWYIVLLSVIIHTWFFFRFSREWKRKRLRILVGNTLVGLLLLIFAGLVAESYLRFVSVETDVYGMTLTSKRWHKVYARLNSQFFRDVEWAEKKPAGKTRVAFVGDSFVYGWGVKNEADRFSNVIQRRFDERTPGAVEVMNFGWSNWDTREELRAIQHVLPDYGVDEVVLCYLPNDIAPLVPSIAGENPNELLQSNYINTDSSFLLDYLYHRVLARRLSFAANYWDRLWDGYTDPAIWTQHANDLEHIIATCRDRGMRLRVVLLPFVRTLGNKFKSEAVHAKLVEFFTARQVPVVDLLPSIAGRTPSNLVVNSHDPHPNELANKLFADAIWDAFYRQ